MATMSKSMMKALGGSTGDREAVSKLEIPFARQATEVPKQDMYVRPQERNPNESISSSGAGLTQLSAFLGALSPSISKAMSQSADNKDKAAFTDITQQIQTALADGSIEDPVQASVLKKSIQGITTARAEALEGMIATHYSSRVTNSLAESMVDVDKDGLTPTQYAKAIRDRGAALVSQMVNENKSLAEFDSLGAEVGTRMENYYAQKSFNFTTQYEARTEKNNKETRQAELAELGIAPHSDTVSLKWDAANPQVNMSGKKIPVYTATSNTKHLHFGMGTGDVGHVNKMDGFAREKLDTLAQKYYKTYGEPLKIVSAFRSEAENKAVGGAAGSKHKRGLAFDVSRDQVDKVYALTTENGKPFTASIGLHDGRRMLYRGRYDVNHFFINPDVASNGVKSSPIELNTPNLSEEQKSQLAAQHNNLNNFMQTKEGKAIFDLASAYHADEVKNGSSYEATTSDRKRTDAMQAYVDRHKMSDKDVATAAIWNIEGGHYKSAHQVRDIYYNITTSTGIFGKTAAYKDVVEPAILQMERQQLQQEKTYAELSNLRRQNNNAMVTDLVAGWSTSNQIDNIAPAAQDKRTFDALSQQGKLGDMSYGEYRINVGVALNAAANSKYTTEGEIRMAENRVEDLVLGRSLNEGISYIDQNIHDPAVKAKLYGFAQSVSTSPRFKSSNIWTAGVLNRVSRLTNYMPSMNAGDLVADKVNKTLYTEVLNKADATLRDLYFKHDPKAAEDVLSYALNTKESGLSKESIGYYRGLLLTIDNKVRDFDQLGAEDQRLVGGIISDVAYRKMREERAPRAKRPVAIGEQKTGTPTVYHMPRTNISVTETEIKP